MSRLPVAFSAVFAGATLLALSAAAAQSGGGDRKPPSVPSNERQVGKTITTITLAWSPSRDNVRVAGYHLYLDGRLVGRTTKTQFIFKHLRCGTTYTVGLVAFDAAGNASRRAFAQGPAKTAGCKRQPQPPVTTSPAPPTAPASKFLSPSGSDSNPCTEAAPCRSWQRGYSAAKASGGGVIQLAGGSYSDIQLSGQTSAQPVIFRPAAGASVSAAEFRTNGVGNVEVDNVSMDVYLNGDAQDNPATNVVLRNDSMQYFYVRNADGLQVIGGAVGGTNDASSPTVGSGSSSYRVRNVLIDRVRFHDVTRAADPAGHVECLFVQESSNVTIRNSTFTNCGVMDIFVHEIGGGGNPDHVQLLNNMLDKTDGGYYAVVFRADSGETLADYVVRGNAFGQPPYLENAPGSVVSGFRVCDNSGSSLRALTNTAGLARQCSS